MPQKGRSHTQFSAHVYCDQTAAWIKMPLGTASAYATLCSMWTQLPPERKGTPTATQFLAHVYCGQIPAWYGSRSRPRPHCTRRGPSSRERGIAAPPPLFGLRLYCGHGRPSRLLLSSCYMTERTDCIECFLLSYVVFMLLCITYILFCHHILHSDRPKDHVRPNALRGWSKHAHHKSRRRTVAILKKIRKIAISPQQFELN